MFAGPRAPRFQIEGGRCPWRLEARQWAMEGGVVGQRWNEVQQDEHRVFFSHFMAVRWMTEEKGRKLHTTLLSFFFKKIVPLSELYFRARRVSGVPHPPPYHIHAESICVSIRISILVHRYVSHTHCWINLGVGLAVSVPNHVVFGFGMTLFRHLRGAEKPVSIPKQRCKSRSKWDV